MNLSVQNGYPIEDFQQGRDGQELDMQEVVAHWYALGLELAQESSVAPVYTQLFYEALARGNHPEVCYQFSLDSLDIEWRSDTFMVTYKNETIDI